AAIPPPLFPRRRAGAGGPGAHRGLRPLLHRQPLRPQRHHLRDLPAGIRAGPRYRLGGALPRRRHRPRHRGRPRHRRVPRAGPHDLRRRLPARLRPLRGRHRQGGRGALGRRGDPPRPPRPHRGAGHHRGELPGARLPRPRPLPAARGALDAALPLCAGGALDRRAGAECRREPAAEAAGRRRHRAARQRHRPGRRAARPAPRRRCGGRAAGGGEPAAQPARPGRECRPPGACRRAARHRRRGPRPADRTRDAADPRQCRRHHGGAAHGGRPPAEYRLHARWQPAQCPRRHHRPPGGAWPDPARPARRRRQSPRDDGAAAPLPLPGHPRRAAAGAGVPPM
ncbi:MAG: Paraquat-inducible protein B, partial [uncultured Craurococcus sp.]